MIFKYIFIYSGFFFVLNLFQLNHSESLIMKSQNKLICNLNIFLIILLITLSFSVQAANGDLLTTFGTEGIVSTDFGYESAINNKLYASVLVDDALFVAGVSENYSHTDFVIAKYNKTDGTLDTSFGVNGIVCTDFNMTSETAKAIVSDGTSLYVAGSSNNGLFTAFAIAKYDISTGLLDEDFGENGLVTTNINSIEDQANVLAIVDGSLYVAGYSNTGSGIAVAVAKYNANTGDLNTAFSSDGIVTTEIGGTEDKAFALTTNGSSLYVAGYTFSGTDNDVFVAKYNMTNGSLITSFDGDGIVTTDVNSDDDEATAITVANSYIYIGGHSYLNGADKNEFLAIKYLDSSGLLEADFDIDGILTIGFGFGFDQGKSISLIDDSIYIAGSADSGASTDFAVAKFDILSGELDTSFDTDGKLTIPLSDNTDESYNIASDGTSIYLVGLANFEDTSDDFAIAKVDANSGELVDTFDSDGLLTESLDPSYETFYAIVSDDSHLYAAGNSFNGNVEEFAIAKYDISTGALVESFGTNGLVTSSIGSSDSGIQGIVKDDTSIYVSGFSSNGSDYDFTIAKYNSSNGDLDNTFDGDGIVITDIGTGYDAAFDLKIVDTALYAAGYSNNGMNYDFTIAKYSTSNGTLDNTFDGDGILITDFGVGSSEFGNKLLIEGDDMYVAGSSGDNFAIAKYNTSSGALNTNFDEDGLLTTMFPSGSASIESIVLNENTLYAAGSVNIEGNTAFALAKYNATTGALDTNFGTDGLVTTIIGTNDSLINDVAILGDFIYATGYSSDSNYDSITTVKYNQNNGEIDTSFGNDGIKIVSQFIGADDAYAMTVQTPFLYIAGTCETTANHGSKNACIVALNESPDEDNDGYTVYDEDCDDSNATVFPSAPEICDSIDNDCNDEIDETFTTLGQTCSEGFGACETSGVYICNEDQDDVVCDAVPGTAVTEICDDTIDNDCDATIDSDDADCVVVAGDDDSTTSGDDDDDTDNQSSSGGCSLQSTSHSDMTGFSLMSSIISMLYFTIKFSHKFR